MSTSGGFQLTNGDVEFLRFAHEFRLLTIDSFAALAGRSYKNTHKRIQKLAERHYFLPITRRPHKHAYGIGHAGIQVLVHLGHAPAHLLKSRIRISELKEFFIQHELLISAIHVRLALFARTGPIKLVRWAEGPAIRDKTIATSENGKRHVVWPDAFFVLRHTGLPSERNEFPFALEADRATMAHDRMRSKIAAYQAWREENGHARKHSVENFRVLTVTETRARAVALSQSIAPILRTRPAQRSILFVPFEDLDFESLVPASASAALVRAA
jgi:hypothetical protein